WPAAARATAYGEWVCTTPPPSARAAMISVWMGYSLCRPPVPWRTSPEGLTSWTHSGVISSSPHPLAFIHTPRPWGSRAEAWPHDVHDREDSGACDAFALHRFIAVVQPHDLGIGALEACWRMCGEHGIELPSAQQIIQ